jgi:hypothetical protein
MRPVSLLRVVAEMDGVQLEPNGFYVPPGDPAALRRAIAYLLEHPAERARLGAAGRRTVERLLSVEHFGRRMRQLVSLACGAEDAPPLGQHAPTPPDAAREEPQRQEEQGHKERQPVLAGAARPA